MMELDEFLNRPQPTETTPPEEPDTTELDVQKVVVESLAAEKAELEEGLAKARAENNQLKSEISSLNEKIAEMKEALEKVGDVLSANQESEKSSQVALLERNPELNDRFQGETHDHVLEALEAAREQAEKEGYQRRAQVLESVICVNTTTGHLAERRESLRRLFAENGNILNGTVISQIAKIGLTHKHGEDYLLPEEIIKLNY